NMHLEESAIPIEKPVRAACELLGLDPLHLACEGRLLAICPAQSADRLLAVMRSHPQGRLAARIGSVTEQTDLPPIISLRTELGGRRIVAWPAGEQLPRIC
ncbi:MAG TPA: AIR synthase-related protein, partial [Pseudomonadota bacterium]|nr:AIR synthase-related protein [Pseudomonadota bacterium]